MKYLFNNRGRNCLDKWSTHKLSLLHMSRKCIDIMILQTVMHYYISHKGQRQAITSRSSQGNIKTIFGTCVIHGRL